MKSRVIVMAYGQNRCRTGMRLYEDIQFQRDSAAVKAGVTLPWSSGPVEGQINRLKMLKRHMFGRARLDLLRRRFLLAPREQQARREQQAQAEGRGVASQVDAAAA